MSNPVPFLAILCNIEQSCAIMCYPEQSFSILQNTVLSWVIICAIASYPVLSYIFFNIYSIKNSYIISMIYNSSLQSCLSTHIPLKTIKICTQGIGLTCFSHGKGCTWSLKGHYCIYPFQLSINFILEPLSIESSGYPSCKLKEGTFLSY